MHREGKGHVPDLSGENGKDRRGLKPNQTARKERDEQRHRDRQEAQHRHRLQHIERGNNDPLSINIARGKATDRHGKDQRTTQRDEHPQRGSG